MIKVTIIVPAHNEEDTIIPLLEAVNNSVKRLPLIESEIIVVNDGSTDRTGILIKNNPDLYDLEINNTINGGKGSAVISALKQATGEFVLFQDADLEYDPLDYQILVKPILEFDADIVIGSRFLAPQWTRVHYFWNKVGNRLITLTFNVLNNTTFTDIYSCYILYRRSLINVQELRYHSWQQQAEILTLAVLKGRVFYDVPISYQGRTYQEGKKIKCRHILSIFWALFLTRLRRS